MTTQTIEMATKVLGFGSLGFGLAGMVAPAALRGRYGITDEGAALTYLGRMWGTRTAALGVLALTADSDDARRRFVMLGAAMNSLDAVTAATTDGLPTTTRVMGALTSGGFAAVAGYALMSA